MFHRIIFLLLIVSSLSWNFNRCTVCFQSFMNIACRSTQNAVRIKRFLRLHIVIKPLNKKINIINSLLFWSVTLLMFIQTLDTARTANLSKVRTGWPYRWFWKSTICRPEYWLSAICLENCEILHSVRGLYAKQNCFVSDVMYKKYKRLVYRPSDLLARFCKVNLSNAKKLDLICLPRICFPGQIYCDQEPLWLLKVIAIFVGVQIRLSTRSKMFHSKITQPLLFDLNDKFINGTVASTPG